MSSPGCCWCWRWPSPSTPRSNGSSARRRSGGPEPTRAGGQRTTSLPQCSRRPDGEFASNPTNKESIVNMPKHLLPTTVVGSYPQPEWLVDRAMLSKTVPRTRIHAMGRLPPEHLEEAQDDATIVAIRDMERAGIDTITDGEIRRESYSNRFATALDGVDAEQPATIRTRGGEIRTVPRIVGPVRWRGPVEVRDVEFLRANTDRTTKITLPGPFTMAQQASNEAYADPDALVMDLAA